MTGPALHSEYLWVTCQVGAEIALKHEIARSHPDLKFAYSRPGFLTFKSADARLRITPDFAPGWIFARAWGMGAGKSSDADLAQKLTSLGAAWREHSHQPVTLHVFERDEYEPGEEPELYFPGQRSSDARVRVMQSAGAADVFASESRSTVGAMVVDAIWVQDGEWWLGVHQHTVGRSPDAGALSGLTLPPGAPSRAYLKLLEVAEWAQVDFQPGQVAIEIGSAPGGAVWALLEKGLSVIGVDPAEMDPRVAGHPQFTHLRSSIADLSAEDFPAQVDWLVVDMNSEPRVSLPFIERVAAEFSGSLRGIIWTLKLNKWALADALPTYLSRLQDLPSPGIARLRAGQLSNHRREIGVVALTRLAQRR